MCPFFDAINNRCKLYDTSQTDYHIGAYCRNPNYFRCANYEGWQRR